MSRLWSPGRVAVASAALVLVLAASILAPAANSAQGNPILPDSGALVGMFSRPKDGDWTQAGVKRRWNTLESAAGRTLDIGHYYYKINEAFPTWRETWHRDSGRVPMVSWASVSTSKIANGTYDAQIKARADDVKAFGTPILIRWFWEMDGHRNASEAESPAKYIAAWRHIVQIFRDRGASNAQFVWCPNADSFKDGDGPNWYPGDAWVDWLCADGYNWAPVKDGSRWRSLAEIFDAFHDWSVPHGKPMMIGETGAVERGAGEKGNWYRQAATDLKTSLKQIDAIVFFDSQPTVYDWYVDSTTSALAGWVDLVNDPWLQGDGGGSPTTTKPTATTTTKPPTTTTTTTTTKPPTTTTTTTTTTTQPPLAPPGGDVEFRAGASTEGNRSSHRLQIPAAVEKGDVMVLALSVSSDTLSIPKPSGWTDLGTETVKDLTTKVMYRVAGSDAGSSITVDLQKRVKATMTLAVYSGADLADPILAVSGSTESRSTRSHEAPAMEDAAVGAMVVRYWADRTSTTTDWETPARQTKRTEVIGSGGGRVTSLLTDAGTRSSRGLEAVMAEANSATYKATMWTIVLKPA